MGGWPAGLWPNINVPYVYAGDSLSYTWLAQRVSEGWIFDNPRSGYPFGSSFLDYPGADAGSLFVIKLFALLSGSTFTALNLYILSSFPAVFVSSYIVGRAFGLFRSFAFVGALLFAFLPFHFMRLGHLFYAWYFVAPFFFYLSFFVFQFSGDGDWRKKGLSTWLKRVALVLGLLAISSFGVYYTLFGVIIVSLGGVLGWFKTRQLNAPVRALLVVSILVAGVALNIVPNIIGKYQNGANPEVAQRMPMESEVYGFKLMQLILPRADHRISWVGKFTNYYNSNYPLINENATSVLGVVGSLGLLVSFVLLMSSLAGLKINSKLTFLVAVLFVLFMFGTVGGLGAVFSSFVSSSIRAWNRISVFVGFGTILIFFVAIQILLEKYSSKVRLVSLVVASLVLCVGLYDQTVPACVGCNLNTKAVYESDRDFIASIEKSLPEGAAIYQLPYVAFPESPPLYQLSAYQLATGVLHSKSLHWSFGGMRGRDGDMFYRSLSQETIGKQLDVIKRLGFSGIYIDRRGYKDNAKSLVDSLSAILGGGPALISANGELVFFRLSPSASTNLAGLNAEQIMERSGYFADHLGVRYSASLRDGIDFTLPGWPIFVRNAKGFSGVESFGRWSDRNLAHSARIELNSPLQQKFTLVLVAQAFASNVNEPIKVLIGNHEYEITLGAGVSEVRLDVDLRGDSADSISFFPPFPVSPKQVGVNGDERKLGIGFVSLRIE
ncbi:sugar translocase [Pseudomonas fluorescens]|nr:sugar translocase [Pseudomonas fluorescens]